MAWLLDTLGMLQGNLLPEVVTGKPLSVGGMRLHTGATASGVVRCVRAVFAELDMPVAGTRAIVQGFGKVGGPLAFLLVLGGHAGGGGRRRGRCGAQPRGPRPGHVGGPRARASGSVAGFAGGDEIALVGAVGGGGGAGRPGRARGGHRRGRCARHAGAGWWSRRPTAPRRPRATASSPSGGSPSSPTSSPTPVGSRRRTSSGPSRARAMPGTRSSWRHGWPRRWTTPSPMCGHAPRTLGVSMRRAAGVVAVDRLAAAITARGLFP